MADIINNKYLVAPVDSIFTGDITFFDKQTQAFLLIDLATRRIPGYKIKNGPFDSSDVVGLIRSIKEQYEIAHSVIFHFDNQSIFGSKEIKEFAKEYSISFSYADPYAMGNQVSERLNRTIKQNFRKKIASFLGGQFKPYLFKEGLNKLVRRINWDQLCTLFDEVITEYNAHPHTGKRVFLTSPDFMDEALRASDIPLVEADAIIAANDNNDEAIQIAEYKAIVIEQYAGNWGSFFVQWRDDQKKQFDELRSTNKRLLDQNEILQKKIDELVQSNRLREKREEEERFLKELENIRKQKRKNRNRLEKRAYVSYKEILAKTTLLRRVPPLPLKEIRI